MKRSKVRLIFQILLACDVGQSKTGIVNACKMNLYTVNPYLDLLIKDRLLKAYSAKPTLYIVTDRGLEALQHLRLVLELMPE